jgi:hypothetical protein
MAAKKLDPSAPPRKAYTYRLPDDVKAALAHEAAKYDTTEARVIVNLVRKHLAPVKPTKREKPKR